jgi:hypothetical protein
VEEVVASINGESYVYTGLVAGRVEAAVRSARRLATVDLVLLDD